MDISLADLKAEYVRARHDWPFITLTEVSVGLPRMMLYAVGSRETNLHNEIGDGGHGHGVWQLDNRSHVIPAGFDADVAEQCHVAASMLHGLLAHFAALHPGVGHVLIQHMALAAYNAGAGTVEYNTAHGLPIDSGTADGDYSADTYARMIALREEYPMTQTNPGPEVRTLTDADVRAIHAAILDAPVSDAPGALSLRNTIALIEKHAAAIAAHVGV